MGWKCVPQILGLVRGEPKPGQKHRADGRKIAKEAGYERASKSDTLDKDRSHLNEYTGFKSGNEFWDAMEQEASEYRVQVHGKTRDGKEIVREKGLQHNAVIGFAVVYNPPSEVCSGWSQEQYVKFYKDCREVMAEIEPRIFRLENIRMSGYHRDEGIPPEENGGFISEHVHDLGVCKDENGKYCGNLIDAKLLIKVNEKFPQMMRDRGWELDDLDTTDWKRAAEDADYRAERNAKRKRSGRSVNKHLRDKTQENLKQSEALLNEAENIHAIAADFMNEAEGADAYAADVKAKTKREKEKADANLRRQKQKLQAISDQVRAKREELQKVEQLITEGLEMHKKIDKDLPEGLYEWLKTKEYRVLDTETIFVSPTSLETKEVIKKDEKGRPMFKTVNPLQDYADYLHGKERGQTLTDEQRETLEDIRREVRRQNQKEDEYSF